MFICPLHLKIKTDKRQDTKHIITKHNRSQIYFLQVQPVHEVSCGFYKSQKLTADTTQEIHPSGVTDSVSYYW
jgi:hypothetical protein